MTLVLTSSPGLLYRAFNEEEPLGQLYAKYTEVSALSIPEVTKCAEYPEVSALSILCALNIPIMVAQECTPTSHPQQDRICSAFLSALCPHYSRSHSAPLSLNLRSVTVFPHRFRSISAVFPHCFRCISAVFSHCQVGLLTSPSPF